MRRSDVYYQFISKHRDADEHLFSIGDDSVCSIRLGMRGELVEDMFVGLYYWDGRRRSEVRCHEDEICARLGVKRVYLDDAIALAKEDAMSRAGLLSSR